MPRINIYSKEECDANFAGAAEVEAKADKAATYTKTETDALMQQERLARAEADENLQDQIDLLEAGSDVKDVVGTYAELQAYDTTTLNPNDIVKVLSDSTHDGAETYYRWIVEGGVGAWQFIGAKARTYTAQETDLLLAQKADKADTYTKAETDTLLLAKQDILVFDSTPRSGSTNPVTSRGIKDALDTKQGQLTASTGITIGAGNIISVDSANAPISGSDRPITSGAVKTALDAKQDAMTLDTQPRSGSTNAIMSGGVYDAMLAKQNKLTAGTGINLGSGASPTISAVGVWEELDLAHLPTDFEGGDVLMIHAYGLAATGDPPGADTSSGIVIITLRASSPIWPELPCKFNPAKITVVEKVEGAEAWNGTGASDVLFRLSNLAPGSSFTQINYYSVKRSELPTYVGRIWRLKRQRKMTAINVYSKEQVDAQLADKQGTLTAGANIIISADNVISSTGGGGGGSYVAGEGISISGQTISNAAIPDVDKAYVDTALADKADTADVYTKTQADTLLALKADKSTTYTKTEVDTALALKANQATTYTKTEVDALVPSVTKGSITLTATGWSGGTQTATIANSSGNILFVSPAVGSADAYIAGGLRVTAQSGNSITFTATTAPSADVVVDWVVIA